LRFREGRLVKAKETLLLRASELGHDFGDAKSTDYPIDNIRR
jgi:hypothetical protein